MLKTLKIDKLIYKLNAFTMKKFIVLYHAPAHAMNQTDNMKPENQAKSMEAWMQWAKNCGDKIVDLGSPLINGQQLSSDVHSKNSDNNVVGYSILQTENMDEAKALLENHPFLGESADFSIEVHETMPLPGM